jgi:hypothetical protein
MRVGILVRSLPLCWLAVAGMASYAQSPGREPSPVACPWLTQGSAARVLGGEVSVSVNLSGENDGWCSFTRKQEPEAFLKIEVSKSALLSCSADSKALKGIGNEAKRCRVAGPGDQDADRISSRVRDLHFNITLNLRAKQSPSGPTGAQEDVLELAAEQVAGNLF